MPKKKDSILAVIVLYKTTLDESISFQSLISLMDSGFLKPSILIYNNYPKLTIPKNKVYTVVNAKKNEMLSGAYNYALNHAKSNNFDWLLILDQDTELTKDYFIKLEKHLTDESSEKVAAIVPFLKCNKIISPHKNVFFNSIKCFVKKSGYYSEHITALNSGSLLSVEFLDKIGGFSDEFKLDMLDYWLYLQIYKSKKRIFVLNTILEHNLSVASFEKSMSVQRYSNLLVAERKYINNFGIIEILLYKLRLVFRGIKQSVTLKNKQFARLTFNNIRRQ